MPAWLGPVEYLFTLFNSNVVHPTFFPYPLAPTLHAARISIAFRDNARRSSSRPHSWGTYLSGFLVMAWSGSILSHIMLSIPPPALYSIHPWINYLSVHIALTAFFYLIPFSFNPRVFDSVFFLSDAVLRTSAIASTLDLVQSHPDPRISQSFFLRILVGAVTSAGGGVTAATLGVWTPDWALSTPVFLRKDATLLSTLDLWAGSLAGCAYGFILDSHPTYHSLLLALSLVDVEYPAPILSPLSAKAIASIILAVLFAWRVARVHWMIKAKSKKE